MTVAFHHLSAKTVHSGQLDCETTPRELPMRGLTAIHDAVAYVVYVGWLSGLDVGLSPRCHRFNSCPDPGGVPYHVGVHN